MGVLGVCVQRGCVQRGVSRVCMCPGVCVRGMCVCVQGNVCPEGVSRGVCVRGMSPGIVSREALCLGVSEAHTPWTQSQTHPCQHNARQV